MVHVVGIELEIIDSYQGCSCNKTYIINLIDEIVFVILNAILNKDTFRSLKAYNVLRTVEKYLINSFTPTIKCVMP